MPKWWPNIQKRIREHDDLSDHRRRTSRVIFSLKSPERVQEMVYSDIVFLRTENIQRVFEESTGINITTPVRTNNARKMTEKTGPKPGR